jgi:galactose mutarotase-like enzyme
MLYLLENEHLTCNIDSVGAEIRSLKHKETGKEYVWQINPEIWGSSSPVLFPSIGNIKDNTLVYNGENFAMTKHGIVRNNNNLKYKQLSPYKCTFTLVSNGETKKKYPFDFVFAVSYELIGYKLIMTYDIENKSNEPMYFSCGGHTAYALPLDHSTQLTDYVIEFPNQSQLEAETLAESGLLGDLKRHYLLKENYLQLNDTIFNDDALIFANINFDWVRLRKKDEEKGIVVRFKSYPNLALWSKPKADYVCIEPWFGLPDKEDESVHLEEKSNYHSLQAQESLTLSIETEIE